MHLRDVNGGERGKRVKLRQLEAMRAVLLHGTTTQAAALMGLTQSAVSRLISQLEEEVGFNLFDRRHMRLLVTPEGQQFYALVEKVLTGVDQITATARDIKTLGSGAVKIITMPALGYGLLPQAVANMKARYKNLMISIDIGSRPDIERAVAYAQYDFGLVTLPSEHETIDVEPLCGVDAICVIPPDHPLSEQKTITAQDLEGEQFISIEPGVLFRYRTDELFGRLGVRRKLGIEAQTTMMVCNLVATGIGVSIVHPFIAATFGDRVCIRPFEPAIRFEYGLLFPAGVTRSQVTQEFIETLRDTTAEIDGSTVVQWFSDLG
jgi:DNA-binding transcriptional LysR family regulator